MYARGRFIITGDDGEEWSPNAFDRFNVFAKRNVGCTGRLYRDDGNGVTSVDSRFAAYRIPEHTGIRSVSAASAGYLGGTLTMTPLTTMLRCNGFDEIFDGSSQLEDGDMAHRLGAAGLRVALDSSIKVTEFAQKKWELDDRVFRNTPHVKCNGAHFYPILFSRKRVAANDRQLSEADVLAFTKGKCLKLNPQGCCSVSKGRCLDEWRWGNPEDDLEFLTKVYRDERLVFSLEELRKSRSWETAQDDPLLF